MFFEIKVLIVRSSASRHKFPLKNLGLLWREAFFPVFSFAFERNCNDQLASHLKEPIQNRRCTVKPPSRISGEFNNPLPDEEENIPIKSISSVSNNKLEKTISNLTQTATTGLKSGSLLQTISDMSENRVKSGDSVGRSVISSASVMTEIVDFFNGLSICKSAFV